MGKIIVKNIKGMGWKARFSLIAVFTLVFSVLIYQGWYKPREATSAVSYIAMTAAGAASGNLNISPPATIQVGDLLVVNIANQGTTNTAPVISTATGTWTSVASLTPSAVSPFERARVYRKFAVAADIGATYTITNAMAGRIAANVYAFRGVDTTTPISGTLTSVAKTAASTALTFGAGTTPAVNNSRIVYLGQVAKTTAYNINTWQTSGIASANWTALNSTGTTNGSLFAATYLQPTAAATGTGTAVISASVTSGGVIMALNPATTTLGNGAAGTTANVAPGSASQKLDGFSFLTSGTSDSVTGLTVTSTGQAAIASMQIWNEAGTTQYYSTVNNGGSDTWVFSGGTAIPVTATAANYKILVTYKTRAGGAPAGNTATTARVTAFTSSNPQTAGTDTADTTLTVINTHAASVWGTNTPGNTQITLNWTYGTSGQSALIVRYPAANSDATKPVDGTTYTLGSAFGTGGTVVYNSNGLTVTDTPLTNGTAYHYKIFEFDTYNNYYNATDNWTASLTPISPDAIKPTVNAGFAATTPTNSLAIPITAFAATDTGGSGMAAYLITETITPPLAGAAGWNATPQATYTVASDGTYTLYPWAKDGADNVSDVYGSPVSVLVDRVKPTVDTFAVSASPLASKVISVTDFTGSDASSGLAAFKITESSTPPTAGSAGWSASFPSTYTVVADGTYTLYPWTKDAAGNVSALYVSPQAVQVDTTAPSVPVLSSPADNALDLPTLVNLQTGVSTDPGGVGGVEYQFYIQNLTNTWNQYSAWQGATTYPITLSQGVTYVWKVMARDSLGNMSAWSTPRTLTIQAPCVRNAPTLTLLTALGGTSYKITSDSGVGTYNLRIINNDVGSCGSSTFNLTVADGSDTFNAFDTPSTLSTGSVVLLPQYETTITLSVKATAGTISGSMRTTVSTAASVAEGHVATTSQYVQTVLNVVGCTPRTPLLLVGPDSGYVARGGTLAYTVTVKNTDAGTGCSPITYNLALLDSNSTEFNASGFSASSVTLNAGELGSTTMTVSAKATATKDKFNNTTISLSSDGSHTNPVPKVVKSTVNNPMLHNSDNLASTRWGGWGIPGKKYGEFSCTTCHVAGNMSTNNIKRIRESISTPDGSQGNLPGHNAPIVFNRFSSAKISQGSLGWDGPKKAASDPVSAATPRTTSTKVCEVCHTYDSKKNKGVYAHPYSSYSAGNPKALTNHFGTDGTDCAKCHKHNKGFGIGGGACIACHGDDTATTITPATDYLVAPPRNYAGSYGTVTKPASQLNNNPKIGAHQTHLRVFNGFTNYSTVDGRCSYCHGPLPTNFNHINGSSSPAFQGLAKQGGLNPAFNATSLTCSSTYCHNPAASTVLKNPTNTGSNVFPTWTSSTYVSDSSVKTVANCSVCHKVPGSVGFQPSGTHSGMSTDTQDCSGCHGHNGNNSSGKLGQRHMDGILFGAGNCNSCHSYDTTDVGAWLFGSTNYGGQNQGVGAHAKHINYIKARWSITLTASSDKFGLGAAAAVCGVCHTNVDANHSMGDSSQARLINFGDGSTTRKFGASNPVYNGVYNTSSAANPKSCSNIDCHYKTTPVWSSY